MKRATLTALKTSIEHWRRLASGNRNDGESTGPDHCALCKEFLHSPNWCAGCPVMQRTGRSTCDGSPYGKADSAAHEHGFDSAQFKRAAKKELAFLESLLPE